MWIYLFIIDLFCIYILYQIRFNKIKQIKKRPYIEGFGILNEKFPWTKFKWKDTNVKSKRTIGGLIKVCILSIIPIINIIIVCSEVNCYIKQLSGSKVYCSYTDERWIINSKLHRMIYSIVVGLKNVLDKEI